MFSRFIHGVACNSSFSWLNNPLFFAAIKWSISSTMFRQVTWNIFSHSWRPEGGWTDVIRRRCCPWPLAALRSPKVVGVAEHGTSPVVLQNKTKQKNHKSGNKDRHLLRIMDFNRNMIWHISNIKRIITFICLFPESKDTQNLVSYS